MTLRSLVLATVLLIGTAAPAQAGTQQETFQKNLAKLGLTRRTDNNLPKKKTAFCLCGNNGQPTDGRIGLIQASISSQDQFFRPACVVPSFDTSTGAVAGTVDCTIWTQILPGI